MGELKASAANSLSSRRWAYANSASERMGEVVVMVWRANMMEDT